MHNINPDPPHLIHISEGLIRLCTTQPCTARKISSFFQKNTLFVVYKQHDCCFYDYASIWFISISKHQ